MGFRTFCKCGCGTIVYGINSRTKVPRHYVYGHNSSKKHLSKSKGWLKKSGYRARYIRGREVLEHRYLMEEHLGRKLQKYEYVDHKNGNKSDNRLENLRLCTKIENEHFYYGITKQDVERVRERLLLGYSYNASIQDAHIKSIATAFRIAHREGLR